MSQSDEWENIKSQYLATLPAQSKIIKTKTLFTHADNFLMENNLTFKDLSHNVDNFKAYLQNKISKNSFQVYWSYFNSFYSWLETNYLKAESVRPQKPQPQAPAPVITEKLPKTINPADILAKFPHCLHNARQWEPNMLVVFCLKNLDPPITDRKIKYFEVTPERCQLCIEISERQKSTNEAIAQQQKREPPKIPSEDENLLHKFPCDKLCKKFSYCTSNAMFYLEEIVEQNCFVSRFPLEFQTEEGKTIRICIRQEWERSQPYGDPEHPYPKCIAKQKDVPFQLPKDRIIRDPDFCWNCVKIRKRQREEQKERQLARKTFGKPYVDWRKSESFDMFRLGDGK